MRKLALTGGIGSGKSTVCHYLEELGAQYVSADKIVHQLLSSDLGTIGEVDRLLGKGLSREEIAEQVFGNPELLRQLEAILHPLVRQEIDKQCAESEGLVVVEIPLLFEVEWEGDFDATVAVIGEDRRGQPERESRQLPMEEKALRADYTINNNGTLEELLTKTKTLFNQLTK